MIYDLFIFLLNSRGILVSSSPHCINGSWFCNLRLITCESTSIHENTSVYLNQKRSVVSQRSFKCVSLHGHRNLQQTTLNSHYLSYISYKFYRDAGVAQKLTNLARLTTASVRTSLFLASKYITNKHVLNPGGRTQTFWAPFAPWRMISRKGQPVKYLLYSWLWARDVKMRTLSVG